MRFLVTNDDGIDAPGIQALAEVAQEFGEVIVVAPDRVHSGCGHRVTTDEAIDLAERQKDWWAITGTPADCVRVGLWDVASQVDWVLAGINSGGNLGVDVFMSGTVAAIREAALHGKPGVAFSHYRRSGTQFDWERAATLARQSLKNLLVRSLQPGEFWNVNLPDLWGLEHEARFIDCPLCPHRLPLHFEKANAGWLYRGIYHHRHREAGDDVDVCFSGDVAVTRMSIKHP